MLRKYTIAQLSFQRTWSIHTKIETYLIIVITLGNSEHASDTKVAESYLFLPS